MLADEKRVNGIGNQFFENDILVRTHLGIFYASPDIKRHFRFNQCLRMGRGAIFGRLQDDKPSRLYLPFDPV